MKKDIFKISSFICCFLFSSTFISFGQNKGLPKKFGPSDQICAGVNIHFIKGNEKDLDMIAAAGFKFIRMDFSWQGTERTKGVYNWENYDELTRNLSKRGLRAIYILDYSNSLYEESVSSTNPLTSKEQKATSSPQHEESVAAFARWAAAAAEHFKKSNIIWEIWNEPNISFWKPKPDVAQYTTLALSTCKAVKKVVPSAVIIGPASSEIPLKFIEPFLASGILQYLDAVSVHPYRDYSKSPETAVADYQKLHELIARYTPASKKMIPIISSEWGYSSATKGVSLEKQAAYIVRMQLSNMLYGIPLSIWYDWKNDGNDPNEHEQNFGTTLSDLTPKPAYKTIQLMNMQLKNFSFLKRITLENSNDFVLVFKNDKNQYKITAWTTDAEHSVILNNSISGIIKATATDGIGNAIKLKTVKGALSLNLTALPQYIVIQGNIRLN